MQSRPRSLQWLEHLSFPIQFISSAIGLVGVWYFTDISPIALAGAGIGIGLAELWQPIKRRYGINSGWGKLPSGLGLVALGIYAFTYSDGIEVLKAGFVLCGMWLTLDGIFDLRTGTGATVSGAPDPMEQFGDAAIVGNTLDDEPRSIEELDATLDLSRSQIENALDMLVSVDAVVERNDRYVATLQDQSLSQALRNAPSQATSQFYDLPARFFRPFRLFND